MGKTFSSAVLSPRADWKATTERIALALICAVSLGIRLYARQFHPFVDFDGTYYIAYFRDASWQAGFHPGYPIVIQLFRLLFPDGVTAAQMVSVVFGALMPIPLFYLSRHFMSSRAALLATVVVVFNPLMIRYGAMTMSDVPYVVIELLAILSYVKRRPMLFGVLSGAAYLTRPEAVVFFGVILLYDIWKKSEWRFARTVALGFLSCALSYVLFLKIQTGEWTLTNKLLNLRVWEADWRANVARETSGGEAMAVSDRFASGVNNYPHRFLTYVDLLGVYGGLPLCLSGIVGLLWKRNIVLAGLPMFFILPLFGLDTSERFILPYVPILGMFGILAWDQFAPGAYVLVGASLMLLGYYSTAASAIHAEEGTTEFCTAGVAIQSVTQPNDIFVDRKPYTAFYAGGNYIRMPNDPVDSILAFTRRVKARYLVVSARVVRVYRPQLNFLLYSDSTISRLHLKTAYVDGLDSGYGIRIIQLSQ